MQELYKRWRQSVVVCVLRSLWTTSVSDQLYTLRTGGVGIGLLRLYMTTNASRCYIRMHSRFAPLASRPEVRE